MPPPGWNFLHFACAALKAGERGSIPASRRKRKPPLALGSGKLGTPPERMHLTNASSAACGELAPAGAAARSPLAPRDPVFAARRATPALEEEPPPQPASSAAVASASAASAPGRVLWSCVSRMPAVLQPRRLHRGDTVCHRSVTAAHATCQHGKRHMRVLLVEDHVELAQTLATGLRREGMAVDLAHSGREAFAHIAVTDYDVLVLDRDLPDVS